MCVFFYFIIIFHFGYLGTAFTKVNVVILGYRQGLLRGSCVLILALIIVTINMEH